MDQQLKDKWTTALRSGLYEQVDGTLRKKTASGVGHCCLDVLLCVSGKYRAPQMAGTGRDEDYFFLDTLIGSSHRHTLQDMNDLRKKTFREIADYIEQKL